MPATDPHRRGDLYLTPLPPGVEQNPTVAALRAKADATEASGAAPPEPVTVAPCHVCEADAPVYARGTPEVVSGLCSRHASRATELEALDLAGFRLRECQECSEEFKTPRRGRPRKYCGDRCYRSARLRLLAEADDARAIHRAAQVTKAADADRLAADVAALKPYVDEAERLEFALRDAKAEAAAAARAELLRHHAQVHQLEERLMAAGDPAFPPPDPSIVTPADLAIVAAEEADALDQDPTAAYFAAFRAAERDALAESFTALVALYTAEGHPDPEGHARATARADLAAFDAAMAAHEAEAGR